MKVKPEKLEEYKQIHSNPPPELLAELRAAGIRNYSIFLWESGNEFGVLECEDWDAVWSYLSSSPIIHHWELQMANFLETPVTAGTSPVLLDEIFRMD